ncbi:MAG: hypothetical protein TH68_04205 [Candidatus Synechococcus spongiarum 142]|uniref:Uncharacterized protein n=1 Tax=Candidatus Synechococcus spongiarum 142 TaxID=1608213 RepID=A0A6N3XBH7_9SYNE|nr:MAG: hypothetical protein TH68_04205 [Candidatus Synechococcus spongiarum 142]
MVAQLVRRPVDPASSLTMAHRLAHSVLSPAQHRWRHFEDQQLLFATRVVHLQKYAIPSMRNQDRRNIEHDNR